MNEAIRLLERDGYKLLFAWVFAEQAGAPIPSAPALMAAGALAAFGHLNWAIAIAVACVAAISGDSIWFLLGRTHGPRVMQLLQKITPSSNFNQGISPQRGSRLLLITKFVPGMSFFTPPLNGVSGMSSSRFLLFDSLGALIWAGSFVTVGRLCATQLELVAAQLSSIGPKLFLILTVGTGCYLTYKIFRSLLVQARSG